MERDFSFPKVVDGLDLFEPERKQPGRDVEPDSVTEPVAKKYSGSDRQKHAKN
jgi:hypothetical protein